MEFSRESDMTALVARFLRNRSYAQQLSEVGFYEHRMDIYGYSRAHQLTVAVELKLAKWSRAVSQALLYQLCSDLVYIAMPTLAARRVDVALLQEYGLGLIAVDKARCRELVLPRFSHVLRRRYRAEYLALLGEETQR